MSEGRLSFDNHELLLRLDSWTLQLYAVQHFDEAVKLFCVEAYESLQCRSVIFFKYLKAFGSLLAIHSEGIAFSEVRGLGLDFSADRNFSAVRDFIRINQNKSFAEMMKKISPNHQYITSLCVVKGEVKGLVVLTDIEESKIHTPYYKVLDRVFSHWLSEINLIEANYNLNRNDEITEVLNKRIFVEYIALEVARAQRIKHPVSFMVVRLDDKDNLKAQLNSDRYDVLRKTIAKILSRATRKTDYIGQLSESEFGVLLPHMSGVNAIEKAKQLKHILESTKYFGEANENLRIQFSICVSEYPLCAHDYEDLYMGSQQRLMLESNMSQIINVSKGKTFEPDFRYTRVDNKK